MNAFHITACSSGLEHAMKEAYNQISDKLEEIKNEKHLLSKPTIVTQSHSTVYQPGVGFYVTFFITLKMY